MRTLASRALPLVLLSALASESACGSADRQGTQTSPLGSATATIENGLPYDGCSWPVRIDGVDYAPDAASLAAIQAFTGRAIGTTTARVHYRLTGRTGRVECGWNSHWDLPEIALTIDVL